MLAVFVYVSTIVLVNWGFAHAYEYALLWSALVGGVFVARDFVQRAIGHWVLAAMGMAAVISYVMADPYVAFASVAAFALAEGVDWVIYTITRRPLHQRILLSSAVAVPMDTLVFLGVLGLLSWPLFTTQVLAKSVAALIVSGSVWRRIRHAHV